MFLLFTCSLFILHRLFSFFLIHNSLSFWNEFIKLFSCLCNSSILKRFFFIIFYTRALFLWKVRKKEKNMLKLMYYCKNSCLVKFFFFFKMRKIVLDGTQTPITYTSSFSKLKWSIFLLLFLFSVLNQSYSFTFKFAQKWFHDQFLWTLAELSFSGLLYWSVSS